MASTDLKAALSSGDEEGDRTLGRRRGGGGGGGGGEEVAEEVAEEVGGGGGAAGRGRQGRRGVGGEAPLGEESRAVGRC